jgi:hypothetical protein
MSLIKSVREANYVEEHGISSISGGEVPLLTLRC